MKTVIMKLAPGPDFIPEVKRRSAGFAVEILAIFIVLCFLISFMTAFGWKEKIEIPIKQNIQETHPKIDMPAVTVPEKIMASEKR